MNPTTIMIVTGIAAFLLFPIAVLIGYVGSKMFLSHPVAEKNITTIANITMAVASACLVSAFTHTAIVQFAPQVMTASRWFFAIGFAFLWFSMLMMVELRVSIIVTGIILERLKTQLDQLITELEKDKA